MVRFPRGVLAVCPMSHPLWRWPLVRMRHRVGNVLKDQDYCESIGASPRNSVECGGDHTSWFFSLGWGSLLLSTTMPSSTRVARHEAGQHSLWTQEHVDGCLPEITISVLRSLRA